MRLILFLVVLYLLYRLSFRHLPALARFMFKKVEKKAGRPQKEDAHDMIPCSACGIYVSKNQALFELGRYFCGEKCRLP